MAQNLDSTKNLLLGLCECIAAFSVPGMDPMAVLTCKELSDIASQALLEFHKKHNVEKWVVKNMINGFWDIRYFDELYRLNCQL